MGQRQNQTEIEYGNDCLTCFPAGKAPKLVYARFSKVEKCTGFECEDFPSPPNDRVFKLTQVIDHPCQWNFEDDAWDVTWYAVDVSPYGSSLIVLEKPNWYSYFDSRTAIGDYCHEFFLNENDCTEGTCGVGGWGIVTYRLESIGLLSLLNIETANDLFMEMRPLEDGKRIYKYCKLKDGINIAIKFNP